MNPRGNPQNLKSFKKGENGGSRGRPKGVRDRRTILKRLIEGLTKYDNPLTGEEISTTIEEKINWSLIQKALSGDVIAIKEIHDTMYGKIPDKQEVKQKGSITITFK